MRLVNFLKSVKLFLEQFTKLCSLYTKNSLNTFGKIQLFATTQKALNYELTTSA